MITKIKKLPEPVGISAEAIKIENLFRAYPDEVQLFKQNETGAVISLLYGDAIIYGNIEADEVKQFLSFSGVKSVFCSSDNMKLLFPEYKSANVLICEKPIHTNTKNMFCDTLSSKEIFDILSPHFPLPSYEHFATDYCRRLNHGLIKVFAKKNLCVALTLESDNCRLLSGIVSNKKGMGGALLLQAINGDKPVLCVCRDELLPFYKQYGFKELCKAGYWRK